MRKKLTRIPMRSLVLIAIIVTTFHSCKKTDTLKPKPDVAERFFNLPADASPALKRIIADLKQKNEEHPFVENFVAREGYPLWKYARMPTRKHSALSRDNADGTDTIIDVPVVLDSATFVKDILSIKLSSDILYKLFKGDEYVSYGFDKDPDRPVPNADDVVARIMAFEHDIWAQNIFKVTDNRLFDYWPQGMTRPESFYISQKLIAYNIAIMWVCDFTTGGQLEGCPPGDDHCLNLVPVYCEDSWTVSTWDSEGGGDDDGGWTTIPSGDGSSGVGGSNPPDPNAPPNHLPGPCEGGRAWVRIVRDEQTGVWKNPCTGEPIPPPTTLDNPDENGFYPSRIQELNGLLANNPFDITPCDEIAALAIYGPMWQDVANYTAPDSVIDRLNTIRQQNPSYIVDDYNIENLSEANGDVINLDFFPIQITQLPFKPNGVRYTPREFLEFFRHNINQFITPPIDVNFSCTFSNNWDDCSQWNSNYESSLGALCSVHLGGPGGTYNSGSIILSDYHSGINSNGTESYWFTVSTLETPFDGEHPVAGNRRWGLYNSVQHPDQWTFYTMATDRTWDIYDGITNSVIGGFDKADALWSNMQKNLMALINSPNNGAAVYYAQHNYKARPDWNDVYRYLRKEITFNELKLALGC